MAALAGRWTSAPAVVSPSRGDRLADGNADQALRVYHAFERHLAAARGFEPSETLRALVAPLLAGRTRSRDSPGNERLALESALRGRFELGLSS